MKIKILCYFSALIILMFSGCNYNTSTGESEKISPSQTVSSISSSTDQNYIKNLELIKAIKEGDKKKVREIAVQQPETLNMKGYLEYKLNLPNGSMNFKARLATPLIAAILTGNDDIAYMLVKFGANIRETGEVEYTSSIDGTISGAGPEIWSPLFAAVQTDNVTIARLLIEKGANINIRGNVGRSLLHIAVNRGNPEMVQMLLEMGADVNACDSYGSTPIASALTTSPEIVAILKKAGARGVERLATDEGDEILKKITSGDIDGVKQIIEKDKKMVDCRGHIDYTVQQGNMKKNYISSNATPLLTASIAGKGEIVKFLIENGAKVDRRAQITYAMSENENQENFSSYDWTPLIGAVSSGNADIAKQLITAGAKIDATTSRGLSPLHIAVRDKNPGISEILLESGADYNTRDSSGNSIIEQADRIGDVQIIDLLKKYVKKRAAKGENRDISII